MSEIFTVNLPDIGEGVVEGEVIEWLKNVGDDVAQDEPIVTVMTDKVTVELPAPHPGKLAKQYFKPGETAYLDKPIYDLEVEQVPAGVAVAKEKPRDPVAERPARPKVSTQTAPKQSNNTGKALATPAIRKLARDLSVDLSEIDGSGKDGRITADDVRLYLTGSAPAAAQNGSGRAGPVVNSSTPIWELEGDERQPIIGIRKMIAERMTESKYIVPHFSYFDQLCATRLIQLRERIKPEAKANQVKLTYMPFFIRALSLTLREFPQVNGSLDMSDNSLVIHKRQNMGIAMQLEDGLVVPVLKDVQDKNLREIILDYERLKNRAAEGSLDPSDMKESTITISNFGALGGRWATPVINYPELAILGVARIREEIYVKHGQIEIQPRMNLSWTFDHRIIDGGLAAAFSNHFIKILENPSALL